MKKSVLNKISPEGEASGLLAAGLLKHYCNLNNIWKNGKPLSSEVFPRHKHNYIWDCNSQDYEMNVYVFCFSHVYRMCLVTSEFETGKGNTFYFIQQTTRLNAFYSHNLFTRSVNYEICYGFDIYNSIYRLNLISREITKIWFILYILVSKTRYVQPVCLLFIV